MIIEKRTELCTRDIDPRVGHQLHQLLKIELSSERCARPIENLERMRLLGGGPFVLFTLCDIERGPDDAIALALLVKEAAALGGNPADYSIFLADRAVLYVIERALAGVHGGGERCGDASPVLRMQARIEVSGHRDRRI